MTWEEGVENNDERNRSDEERKKHRNKEPGGARGRAEFIFCMLPLLFLTVCLLHSESKSKMLNLYLTPDFQLTVKFSSLICCIRYERNL